MKLIAKKTFGIILILIGLVAFFTPFTPGSWLALIGLEMIGLRLVFLDVIRVWWQTKREKNRASSVATPSFLDIE